MNIDLIDKYIVEIAKFLNEKNNDDLTNQFIIESSGFEYDEVYLLLIAAKQLLKARKDAPPKKTLIKRIINE